MFETFLNTFLVLIMISFINCENSIVIREDRVYRYVGNASDGRLQTNGSKQHIEPIMQINQTHPSTIDEEKNPIIPESILIQMKDISNASDFISNFLMADNNNNNNNDKHKEIYLDYLERGLSGNQTKDKDIDINEERSKLTKLPRIGSPAACIPELKIIELKASDSHNELYFPSCIRISRCSGCCPSQRLQCVPINTSLEDITVIRVKYSPIEKRLKFEGFKVFRIEKHDNCKCDCIQKSDDCSSNQIYSESECRCVCAHSLAANDCQTNHNKYWDPNQCDCKCKSVPFCSTGSSFNNNTCLCESDEEEEEGVEESEQQEEESNASPDLDYSMSESTTGLEVHRYVVDKRINSEMEVQNTKGLDMFKVKGINPDIDEEFHQNSGSFQ